MSQRLHALLDMRQHDSDGHVSGPKVFVLGNAVGECIHSVDTMWTAACRRAGSSG